MEEELEVIEVKDFSAVCKPLNQEENIEIELALSDLEFEGDINA